MPLVVLDNAMIEQLDVSEEVLKLPRVFESSCSTIQKVTGKRNDRLVRSSFPIYEK
jgi:hypothetical protein